MNMQWIWYHNQSAGAEEYSDCICWGGKNTPLPNECPDNDTQQSDGETPVLLKLWGMWSSSLPSLPGPLWPGVVSSDRVLSKSKIGLFDI